MNNNHLVIGAGVAGLSCARALAEAGHEVVVIDKARGVGGRCATRRVNEQPVDFGPVFLHGSDPDFELLIRSIPSVDLLEEWPKRRRGAGKPCQHEAFLSTEKRFAIAQGLTALPKYLAEGLNVRLETRASEITIEDGSVQVRLQNGETLETKSLVLAMPVEQTLTFVWPLVKHSEELEAIAMLLDMIPSLPCLTVMAGYPMDVPAPAWDVFYPENSTGLMLVANDSAKRRDPKNRVLVLQALPRWSRQHLDDAPETWSAALLAEAGTLVDEWAAKPVWTQTHRWRYGRVDLGNELTGPVRIGLPGGTSLGLAGDVFAPGGGVEAAWNAGRTLARRLFKEDDGNE